MTPTTTGPTSMRIDQRRRDATSGAVDRPAAAASSGQPYLRRRLVAVAVLVLVVTLVTMAVSRVGAEAELEDPVAGHVVVAPGDTLWDVAVESAPDGVDPRRQLTVIRELNGLDGSHVDAWDVVLIPAW